MIERCASKADCADNRYYLVPKKCSASNTCVNFYDDIYAYCTPGYEHHPGNCGTQECGGKTYYCTNDGSTWAWRLTKPAEVCNNEIDNDCDGLADNNDIDCCDSASYTSCNNAYKFTAAGAKANMCADQYYYTSVSSPTSVTWTITPDSGVDYDLYTKKGSCPTTSSYDSRTKEGAGIQESLASCLSLGSSYALARKYSGSGAYDISLTKTSVECCSDNDCINNPKGNKCLSGNVCGCRGITYASTDCAWSGETSATFCPNNPRGDPHVPNYVLPTCPVDRCVCDPNCGDLNSKCAANYCCTGADPNALSPECVSKGIWTDTKWLCDPGTWLECNENNINTTQEFNGMKYKCIGENNEFKWINISEKNEEKEISTSFILILTRMINKIIAFVAT